MKYILNALTEASDSLEKELRGTSYRTSLVGKLIASLTFIPKLLNYIHVC